MDTRERARVMTNIQYPTLNNQLSSISSAEGEEAGPLPARPAGEQVQKLNRGPHPLLPPLRGIEGGALVQPVNSLPGRINRPGPFCFF